MSAPRTLRWLTNVWSRRLHRWGAVVAAAPVLVILCSGLLLQLKKEWSWVQPPTMRGEGGPPTLGFDRILGIASGVSEAGIRGWGDVERLDVQPPRGIVKVQSTSKWEVQIDTATGEVLQVMERRSDLIEAIHDGSWFHPAVKLWVFLPAEALLLGLWVTGVYLWILPIAARRAGRRRRAEVAARRLSGASGGP